MKAILKLGYSCNNNCMFCHARTKKNFGELAFEQAKKKIALAKKKGVKCIIFSGGEPTIRKDIFKIIGYANKKGISAGLVTNARMLSSDAFFNKLLSCNIKCYYTTLHSLDEDEHNGIARADSFKQAVRGIENLAKNNIGLLVNIVVTNDNLYSIEKTVNFLKKLGIKRIKLSIVEPICDEDKKHAPDIMLAAKKVKSILAKNDNNVGFDGFPLCLMNGYERRLINLRSEGINYISEVWENDFFPSDEGNKIKLSKCKYCKLGKSCGGIYPKYVDFNPSIKHSIKPYLEKQIDNELFKDMAREDDVRLVLLAARACCLNCKYCFVKMTNEVMDESTLMKSVDFLFTSRRKKLQLQFFGGEPLMLPDKLFKKSVKYAVEKARSLNRDIKIIITTNSVYLTADKIKFLENYKDHVIIEVSLDGDKESQNINRPQKNKKEFDSYSVITKNFPILLASRLDYRISMVVSPETCRKLLHNFEHLLDWGFRKIWMMLSCGVLWKDEDVKSFSEQLGLIGNKYYDKLKTGEIVLLNLRDWFAPYRMNTELIVDLNEKIYPACMNYLIDSDEIKDEFCLGNLNDLKGKNIDYYDNLRISNDHAISVFFKENKIIPNYESNIKTGLMINKFIKKLTERLKKEGISLRKLFKDL